MTRKISEIGIIPYGDTIGGKVILCEPTREEIQQAIANQELEARGYQADLALLIAEWKHGSQDGQDHEKWGRLVKTYHARRVAHFVVHGWSDPIAVTADGRITDGSHRIRAAIYLGWPEIEITIGQ